MSRVLFVIEGKSEANQCHEDLPESALPQAGQIFTPGAWKGRKFKVLGRRVGLVLSSSSAEPFTLRLEEMATDK